MNATSTGCCRSGFGPVLRVVWGLSSCGILRFFWGLFDLKNPRVLASWLRKMRTYIVVLVVESELKFIWSRGWCHCKSYTAVNTGLKLLKVGWRLPWVVRDGEMSVFFGVRTRLECFCVDLHPRKFHGCFFEFQKWIEEPTSNVLYHEPIYIDVSCDKARIDGFRTAKSRQRCTWWAPGESPGSRGVWWTFDHFGALQGFGDWSHWVILVHHKKHKHHIHKLQDRSR